MWDKGLDGGIRLNPIDVIYRFGWWNKAKPYRCDLSVGNPSGDPTAAGCDTDDGCVGCDGCDGCVGANPTLESVHKSLWSLRTGHSLRGGGRG